MICRLCIESNSVEMHNIFTYKDPDPDGIACLGNSIFTLFSIEVKQNDNMPQTICESCLNIIKNFYLLRKLFTTNNETLKDQYNLLKTKMMEQYTENMNSDQRETSPSSPPNLIENDGHLVNNFNYQDPPVLKRMLVSVPKLRNINESKKSVNPSQNLIEDNFIVEQDSDVVDDSAKQSESEEEVNKDAVIMKSLIKKYREKKLGKSNKVSMFTQTFVPSIINFSQTVFTHNTSILDLVLPLLERDVKLIYKDNDQLKVNFLLPNIRNKIFSKKNTDDIVLKWKNIKSNVQF